MILYLFSQFQTKSSLDGHVRGFQGLQIQKHHEDTLHHAEHDHIIEVYCMLRHYPGQGSLISQEVRQSLHYLSMKYCIST